MTLVYFFLVEFMDVFCQIKLYFDENTGLCPFLTNYTIRI